MRRSAVLVGLPMAALLTYAPAAQAAAPSVQITRVYYDSPGSDRGGNKSVNGEYIVFKNTTRRAVELAGWTVRDKNGFRYTFGDVTLRPGKSVRLRSGMGNDGTSTVYWQRKWYVWNNDKDTAYLRSATGKLIDSCSYNSSRVDYVNC